MKAIFLRVLETEDKATALRAAIREPRANGERGRFEIDLASFYSIPRSPFAYWLGSSLLNAFSLHQRPTGLGVETKCGLGTLDDFRFLRCWWEVGQSRSWAPLIKGGESSAWHGALPMVVLWDQEGRQLKQFVQQKVGSASRKIQAQEYYRRSGLTWSRRPHRRGAFRFAPAGALFADNGPMAFGDAKVLATLLPLLNSSTANSLMQSMMSRGQGQSAQTLTYEVGVIDSLPIPDSLPGDWPEKARSAWLLKRSLYVCNETSREFALAALLHIASEGLSNRTSTWLEHVSRVYAELAVIQSEIDELSFDLYEINPVDRRTVTEGLGSQASTPDQYRYVSESEEEGEGEPSADTKRLTVDLISWVVGVAFGRFDVRLATGERPAPPEPEPFDPQPVSSPGMLTGEDGLPLEAPPAGYCVDFPRGGILVDDAGAPRDLVAAVRQVFDYVFNDPAARWEEAAGILDERDRTLRRWFAKDFFALHLKQYSKSRRRAPIYWPLSTGSGSYTIWIYHNRLTADTLFQVIVEYLDPKIRKVQEERLQVDGRLGRAEGRDAANLAKQAGELAELEQELEEMKAELLRVADLPYQPNRNDGVQITAAPLWKLFRLPAWRKALEATWRALERGDYDWAHLANTIWPDRVRQKCKSDRSLAIAHGLEDLCEIEARPKKGRRPRRTG